MSQYLQDTLFELEVPGHGAEQPKKPLTGCKIEKHKGAFLFYVGKEPSDALRLPIDTVTSAEPNHEDCTLEIKTKNNETYKLTFYIQSHLNFFAEHLPKHLSTQFKIKEQPKDEAEAEMDAPKEMKNPLVLIIAISEYCDPDQNLPSAKCDLGAYRNLFENEYRWTVQPMKCSQMNRKTFWTRSDILNFIKEESGQLFDDRLRYDGLVVVLRGHGGDGTLIDSEGTHIPLTFLHDMVSYAQDPRFEAVPRLFIVDACRGWRGFLDEDEKQSQGTNIQPQGKYWRHHATHGQRNNLATLYGTVSGFVAWAIDDKGAFSSAVIETLKQNARRQKQLAFLVTEMRKELKKYDDIRKTQISVLDGDTSLNPLWMRPKDHTRACSSEEIEQVVLWLQYLTNCSLKPDSFFESICDGHLLCSALNAIRPGTCSIKYPTAAEQSRRENIQQFIIGCKLFGVDERFVIKPEALDSARTIIDVMCNIYALCVAVMKCAHYKGKGIPGEGMVMAIKGKIKGRKVWDYIGRVDEAGKMMGYGKQIWVSGASYTGGYVNGLKEGTGTRVSPNGDVYYGEWKNNKKDGYGKIVTANGKFGYEGRFKDGLPHGYGTKFDDKGDVYEGAWQNGKRNGFGSLYDASGNVFIGDFKDDQRHGRGTYWLADGRGRIVEFEKDKEIRAPSPQ